MSEQKTNYMAELEMWAEAKVIQPLVWAGANGDDEETEKIIKDAKEAIRAKTLESYKNGLKAGAAKAPARKEPRR